MTNILARQVLVGFCIDLAEKIEPISIISLQIFPRKIFIEEENKLLRWLKKTQLI